MTKEELKKEAEEYAEGMAKYYASTHEGFIPSQFEKYLRNACVSSAEPREKRIAELEKENAELKERNAELKGMYAHSAREAGTYKQFLELKEKENAELETRCNELFLQTCEQAEKIKELKSEIENDRDLPAIAYMQGAEKQKKKDEEELQKWKDEWQEQVQKANDESYARTLQTIQLTKAKEIIKEFVHHYKAKTIYIENMKNLLEQAEQFLSEVKNEKHQRKEM